MGENGEAVNRALIAEDENEEEAPRAPIREERRLRSERMARYTDNVVVPRHLVTRTPLREIESIGRWDENSDYHEEMFNVDGRAGRREPPEVILLNINWIGDAPSGDLATRIVADALEMAGRELQEQATADRLPA